ncbi:hypothetical protein D3C86_1250510 [compost metagenome]
MPIVLLSCVSAGKVSLAKAVQTALSKTKLEVASNLDFVHFMSDSPGKYISFSFIWGGRRMFAVRFPISLIDYG